MSVAQPEGESSFFLILSSLEYSFLTPSIPVKFVHLFSPFLCYSIIGFKWNMDTGIIHGDFQ